MRLAEVRIAAHRLRAAAAFALAFVVPSRCAACRAPARDVLCESCAHEVSQLVPAPAAAVPDIGAAARLVRRGKESGARRAAHAMAELTFARMRAGACTMPAADAVTYVPADPKRGRRRGYHLPALYAQALARMLQLPCEPLLQREHAPPQRGSDVASRHRNVRGRFHARSRAHGHTGRRVLVVDDVTTTGATLEHAADALRIAGVQAVPFAFAAVPRRRPR